MPIGSMGRPTTGRSIGTHLREAYLFLEVMAGAVTRVTPRNACGAMVARVVPPWTSSR